MVRFDAYSATTQKAKPADLVDLLRELADGEKVELKTGHGFHSFGERVAARDESGSEFGSVMWGGRQGDWAMIEVKGERTPKAVEALRERYWHRVTRVDACADFDAPGAFDGLLGHCLDVKKAHRLKGSKLGDWEDFPEDGRTLYLGAPSSVARVRLYEKGKQQEYRHLERFDWTRLEVQVRPAKEAKADFNSLGPLECWGASKWTRDLAGRVLQQHIDPHPAGTVYKMTERDRALRWMCKQYGVHLVSLADDLGGWDVLGLTLREILIDGHNGVSGA
jgi:Replication initiation factor